MITSFMLEVPNFGDMAISKYFYSEKAQKANFADTIKIVIKTKDSKKV